MTTTARNPLQGYYAHSSDSRDTESWQPLSDHLEGTGRRAAEFLDQVGVGDTARIAGLLHDLGKYTTEFQHRLAGGPPCDHATAGAQEAIDRFGQPWGKVLAYCIAGHHTGLANGVNGESISSLEDRLAKNVPRPDPVWQEEIKVGKPAWPKPVPRDQSTRGFSAAFFTRMVFSALVDADFLDTEAYYTEQDGRPLPRARHPSLHCLAKRLERYLQSLAAKATPSPVNALREEILKHVRSKAGDAPGLFTLTVPTGGGKTLTSLAFALDHAIRHGHSRVIYVIPYMSIIEQTAAVFRDALRGETNGDADFVLEHHSTFDEDRIGNREARQKLRLAMQNWDVPIIVTTAVQFFESLFANRPSRCRKLHNIANSVVILDEAQTLPLGYLRPCVAALDELARNWQTSVVLCTATQPALSKRDDFREGLIGVRELAPDPPRIYRALKRTRIVHCGPLGDADLAERLRTTTRALCIVNTRRHARELYEMLGDVEEIYHLTTLMCAFHRRQRLDVVRDRLRADGPVRLIATSLVEAGVDLDFPVVWRAESGLESIIQAAGRCNREGTTELEDVFVFAPEDVDGRRPPPEVVQAANAARSVMRRHEDPASLNAIEAYFRELYWSKGSDALDQKGILRLLGNQSKHDYPFDTVANRFKLIETPMVPVIVCYGGANGSDRTATRLVDALAHVDRPGGFARQLQPFVVQVPPYVRQSLLAAGAAELVQEARFADQFVVLTNMDLYDADVGLTWDDPTFRTAEGLVC